MTIAKRHIKGTVSALERRPTCIAGCSLREDKTVEEREKKKEVRET